jgi:hypothetical protein
MRCLVGFVFVLALGVIGCGDANEGGGLAQWVTGGEAEHLCEAWCDPDLTCRPPVASDEACLGACRYKLAGPCGRYWAIAYECRLELDCPDELGGCQVTGGLPFGYQECREEILQACDSCPPGTARHDACLAEPVCGYSECSYREVACFESGGDCNADYVTERCKRRNRAGNPDCSGIYEDWF